MTVLALAGLLSGPAFADGPFTNWPTYASTTTDHWPKASEYDKFINDITWTHNALQERCSVIHTSTNFARPVATATRWPSTDVAYYKALTESAITYHSYPWVWASPPESYFVDDSLHSTFTTLADLPGLTVTGLLGRANLPSNHFEVTFSRCLADVMANGEAGGYGLPSLRKAVNALKWTGHILPFADSIYHSTDAYWRAGEGWGLQSFPDAISNAISDYYSSGWLSYTNDAYYHFQRDASIPGSPSWSQAYCERISTIPQFADITVPTNASFGWEAYFLVNIVTNTPVYYDGYAWVDGSLNYWDEAGETSQTTVQAERMGMNDEASPMEAEPAFDSALPEWIGNVLYVPTYADINCYEFQWVLKWTFQYREEEQ